MAVYANLEQDVTKYPVNDIAALKAVDMTSRSDGLLVIVRSSGSIFEYDKTSTVTADDISVVAPTVGGGRWILKSSINKSGNPEFLRSFEIPNGSTATTQALGDSTTKIATTEFVTRQSTKYARTISVASGGTGNFSDIQAAIDSITDASASNYYLIQVYPGTYSAFVCKDYIDIVGASAYAIKVEGDDTLLSNVGSNPCRVERIDFVMSPTVDGKVLLNLSNNGLFNLVGCSLTCKISTAGVKAKLYSVASTNLEMRNVDLSYEYTGGGAISGELSPFSISGNSKIVKLNSEFDFYSNQSSGDLSLFDDASIGNVLVNNFRVTGKIDNIAWAGNYYFSKTTANELNAIKTYNNVKENFQLPGGSSYFAYTNSSTGVKVSFKNFISSHGSSVTRYSGYAGNASDIVKVLFGIFVEPCIVGGPGKVDNVSIIQDDFTVNTAIIDENIRLGNATNKSLQDLFNINFSAGWVSGAGYTDNGNGTITVNAGKGLIRVSNDEQSQLKSFDHNSATTNLNVTPDDLTLVDGENYIYIDYNSGSPTIKVTQSGSSVINENDKYELYEIYKEGTDLHITEHKHRAKNAISIIQSYFYSLNRIRRASAEGGLILSESADGNRYLRCSQGNVWVKLNKVTLSSFDSSTSDRFDMYYRVGETFVKVSNVQTWDNLNYNNTATGLVGINNNYHTYLDFYRDTDSGLFGVYGTSQYVSLADAIASNKALPPGRAYDHAIYLGRLCFKKSDNIATVVSGFSGDSPEGAIITSHNSLSDLQFAANSITYGHINDSAQTIAGEKTFSSNVVLSQAPTLASHSVRKDYVDALVQNVKRKDNCLVATTENITLSGEQTIDGVLTSNSRVLVWQQTDQTQNGIYLSSTSAWSRTTDADTGSKIIGALVKILQGSAYSDHQFNNSNSSTPTIGVTNITWVQFGESVVHNSLIGLQGGSESERYHLSESSYNNLNSSTTQFNSLRTNAGTDPSGMLHYSLHTSEGLQWAIGMQNTRDFLLFRYNDGSYQSAPINVSGDTGLVSLYNAYLTYAECPTPTAGSQVTNKDYVDSKIQKRILTISRLNTSTTLENLSVDYYYCDHVTGFTITLPSITSAEGGEQLIFDAGNTGSYVIEASGGFTINGAASVVLFPGESLHLVVARVSATDYNWRII